MMRRKQLLLAFLMLGASILLLVSLAPLAPALAFRAQQGGDPYADRVASFIPGSPASTCCNDPDRVLGPPDLD
jgi:hypothetical protein